MLSGFKQFLLRGNVVDLAVGVVIGAAFGGIVDSLVKDLITPLIGAVGGQPDFSAVAIPVGASKLMIGNFLNAVISFLIKAAAIYFLVVLPINTLIERTRKAPTPADPTTKKCPECFSEIPIQARRCPNCTSVLSGEVSAR